MAQFKIDEKGFLKSLKGNINESMMVAAEPVIQAALKDIEIKMREDLAKTLIGFIESYVSMERYGTDLRITINKSYER